MFEISTVREDMNLSQKIKTREGKKWRLKLVKNILYYLNGGQKNQIMDNV